MSIIQPAPEPLKKRGLPRKASLFSPTIQDMTITRGKATKSTPSKSSPSKKTTSNTAKPGPAAAQQSKILRAIASSNPSSSSPSTISQPPPTPSNPSSSAAAAAAPAARKQPLLINDFPIRAKMRGRSPAQIPETPLPSNYKSVANKVTMVIVAMPILLVTSWVLYERLVLGEERKLLVQPTTEGKREKREL
ncbi:hypothetical protein M430DRAFT_29245 [Amorphotheca resinae ATCC 22711]|uniref:Uncharacterized protein n=1 Tax=Amorphotheca resinae ATCC 22711 TaxID=857342 RepID=A0A2T3AYW5_AMORE|nr:hypothetical protein M430DRAFT_29245 [Amorphotheca resinae ATCC 22711]PSS15257.1 hypothetical protein M430DRAFT_29245 [Amorphotheca resinae ATCC 22711]